ncbi:MAG TPA: prepilin-type N-terminal cleavage/methylation domain-containing protein [Methylomirabilota bacterium]
MRLQFAVLQQGLTLPEVLAALTVLSIGLLAMISLLPVAASGIHQGAHRSGAIFLASERLEQVRHAVGLADHDVDPLREPAAAFGDEPALPAPYEAFSRIVRVRDCGDGAGCAGLRASGIRQVSVTVTYPAPAGQLPGGSRDTVVLSTYIATR